MTKMKSIISPSTLLAVARRGATLSAATVTLLFVTATGVSAEPANARSDVVIDPATAESETHGVEVGGPSSDAEFEPLWQSCLTQSSTGNIACFEDYGDKFYVYDGDADGASAAAYWWTDYGRSGICYNSSKAGTWVECNYNMDEDGIVYWQTCYQNRSAGGDLYCTADVMARFIDGR